MLPLGMVGKGFSEERSTRFTKAEQVTMMTLWCIFRSPLMVGAELTKLDDWTLSLLTNREALSLLEDGHHGVQVQRTQDYAVWAGWNEKGRKRVRRPVQLKGRGRQRIRLLFPRSLPPFPVKVGEKLMEKAASGEIALKEL